MRQGLWNRCLQGKGVHSEWDKAKECGYNIKSSFAHVFRLLVWSPLITEWIVFWVSQTYTNACCYIIIMKNILLVLFAGTHTHARARTHIPTHTQTLYHIYEKYFITHMWACDSTAKGVNNSIKWSIWMHVSWLLKYNSPIQSLKTGNINVHCTVTAQWIAIEKRMFIKN